MKRPLTLIAWALLLVGASPKQAFGQTSFLNNLPGQDTTALNQMYENLEPAELIAPTLLDVSATSVSRPSGIQDVSVSLINSFKSAPNIGEGIGVEFSPLQLLEKTDVKKLPQAAQSVASALRNRFVPQYQSLANYRKSYGLRPLTLSGAAVSDSLTSRMSFGVSYTIGAGQLDPYKAHGYMEKLTAEITKLSLQAGTTASALQTDYAIVVDTELKQLVDNTKIPLDILVKADFVPQLQQIDASTSAQALSSDSLKAVAESKLSKEQSITSAQRAVIMESVIDKIIPAYQAMRPAVIMALKPAFASIKTLTKNASEQFERDNWNASLLQIGVGGVGYTGDRNWNDLKSQSFHVFLRASGRLPLGKNPKSGAKWWRQHAQAIANVQYGSYADRPGAPLKAKAWGGLRLLLGNERIRFSCDFSLQHQSYFAKQDTVASSDFTNRWTVGFETRMADNLWLEVAFGKGPSTQTQSSAGQVDNKSSALALGSLKYGFRNRRRFKLN